MKKLNPDAFRSPDRAVTVMARRISDMQWSEAEIHGVLFRAMSEASQTEDDALARKLLEQAITTTFDYLNGTICRPDPELGETRFWHQAHEVGERCLFHDKLNNLTGVIV